MTEMLETVLQPFPEKQRAEMLLWVDHEMRKRPIIDNVTSTKGVNWILGEPSPGNAGARVFAMLFEERWKAVCIYSVAMTPTEGGTQFQYFREVCFDPEHMHGPISGEALHLDLHEFMVDDLGAPEVTQ